MTTLTAAAEAAPKQSYEIRACNLWRGWRAQISSDMKDDSEEGPVWKAVIETMCKIPELKPLLDHPGTRYYNNDLDILTASFSADKLREIASKFVPTEDQAYPSILIVPPTYHTTKDQPRSVKVSIEGEPPFLWLLHKTDFKDKDSYFDQLKYDIEHARTLNDKLGQPQDLVPSPFANIKYRFFTSDSHAARAQTCLEVTPEDLDSYLTSISTSTKGGGATGFQWVIRTNASVETECTLKKVTFSKWCLTRRGGGGDTGEGLGPVSAAVEEKKVRVAEEVKGVASDLPPTNRQLYLQAQTLGTNRPQLRPLPGLATLTPATQPTGNVQKQIDVEPPPQEPAKRKGGTGRANFRALLQQLQNKVGTIPIHRFFPRLRGLRADPTTGQEDVSAGIVYFALSIVAVVVVGLIITTAIIATQKKKKNDLLLRQAQQQQQPPPTFTSVAEQEVASVPDPYNLESLRAAAKLSSGKHTQPESDEDRSRIDSLITKENKHYPSAQRIQYKGPAKSGSSSFSQSLARQDELEKTLGFPSSRLRAPPTFGKSLYTAPVQSRAPSSDQQALRGILRPPKPVQSSSECGDDSCSFAFR